LRTRRGTRKPTSSSSSRRRRRSKRRRRRKRRSRRRRRKKFSLKDPFRSGKRGSPELHLPPARRAEQIRAPLL
jgi:hypothetical protein